MLAALQHPVLIISVGEFCIVWRTVSFNSWAGQLHATGPLGKEGVVVLLGQAACGFEHNFSMSWQACDLATPLQGSGD